MIKQPFTIGADPEFILLKDGKTPVSAEGVIGHGKDEPLDMENGTSVHEDNILVEFNIQPAHSKAEFLKNNLKALYVIWHTFLKEKGFTISKDCYAEFNEEETATEQAMAVGCSPEFDALSCSMLEPPQLDRTQARTAGGHVHIGYPNENNFDSMMIVKMLDLYLGIPSLILDKDKKRRQLYGKASSYRRNEGLKVEYRTLSNFWLFDKTLIDWVYRVVEKVVNEVLNGTAIDDDLYMHVRDVINNNDEAAARKIIAEQSDILLPYGTPMDLLEMVYSEDAMTQEFINDVSEPVETFTAEEQSEFEKQEAQIQKAFKSRNGGLERERGGNPEVRDPGRRRSASFKIPDAPVFTGGLRPNAPIEEQEPAKEANKLPDWDDDFFVELVPQDIHQEDGVIHVPQGMRLDHATGTIVQEIDEDVLRKIEMMKMQQEAAAKIQRVIFKNAEEGPMGSLQDFLDKQKKDIEEKFVWKK